jgi:hypothetical protein
MSLSLLAKASPFLLHSKITQTSICSVRSQEAWNNTFHFLQEENKDLLTPDISHIL